VALTGLTNFRVELDTNFVVPESDEANNIGTFAF
jgi:hypothetical protein